MKKYLQKFIQNSSLLREYLWKYRKWVAIGLVALVIVDILEVLPPVLIKWAIDGIIDRSPEEELYWIAGAYLGIALLQGVGRWGWRMFLIRASMLAGKDLREKYATHLFSLSASFYDRRKIGELMSLATNDVESVRMALGAGLLTLADGIFYLLFVPVAMFLLSPKLAVLSLIPLVLIPGIVFYFEKEVHARFEKVQEQFSELSSLAQENLTGVRVIKGFAVEDVQLDRFSRAGKKFIDLNIRFNRVQSSFGPLMDFAMSLGMVAMIYLGGRYVMAEAVSVGTFVAFQRYIQKMIWPMAAMGHAMGFYQRAVASSDRLKEVLAVKSDVPESESPRLPEPKGVSDSSWRTSGKVEFRNLTFSFPGNNVPVLNQISLTIEPGERVAFVGTIGSGKSALLGLLPRLYPVQRGMLFIDDVDINDWPIEELRRQVGFVAQDVFLFSESVRNNVAYGFSERDDGEWKEWASETPGDAITINTEQASVHEDILRLQSAYKTKLGERGVNLSGGQKQRLTIARALARKPAILVLDDALSSVDIATEEKILKSLRSRADRNTEIIAAHRISTVKDSDRIVVLDGGYLRQCGTHLNLMKDARGAYRRFFEQQQLREDLEAYVDQSRL